MSHDNLKVDQPSPIFKKSTMIIFTIDACIYVKAILLIIHAKKDRFVAEKKD
jgi:hypothetical protein